MCIREIHYFLNIFKSNIGIYEKEADVKDLSEILNSEWIL